MNLYRYFLTFGAMFLVLLGFALIFKEEEPVPPVVFRELTTSTEVATSSKKIETTKSVSSVAPVAVSNVPKNDPIKKPPLIASTVKPNQYGKQYGIAAGGGLIFLGQKELDTYFEALQALGVSWVRWDVDWGVVQPVDSITYQWAGADRVVETANRYGIHSLGIITYAPAWAVLGSCSAGSHCPPADPKAFGHFAGEVALRYKNSVQYWEIWNEPNYVSFWSPNPDVGKYSELLKESYIEIKKVNPQAVVLSGGLAAIGDEPGGNISPDTFVGKMYELGANQYFDAVALHPYTYPGLPNYKTEWNRWQQIVPIHQLMVNKGDGAKKIWITEFGAPTGGPGEAHTVNQFNDFTYGSDFMWEKAQSDILIEVIGAYRQYTDWMGPFFWYSLKDGGTSTNTPENFFGLLRYSGSKKPAYDVFKNFLSSGTL